MTKAQQILELYGNALGTMPERKLPNFIAAQLGTTDAYVRTVARQRLGRGVCDAERRYRASPLGLKTRRENARKRYWSDPAYREKELANRSRRRAAARLRAESRAS